MGRRSSKRVKPCQQVRALFPVRRLARFRRWIDLLKDFPFGFKIGSCVVVSSIQTGVPKPILDDGHIDARGDHMDIYGVPKCVWSYMFSGERDYLLSGRLNILIEFKSNARCTERFTIAIDKDRFIVSSELS